ncbi:hypothetical protein F4779DRAFT_624022 [Xylariaceae sp. FL0662B]|nr:hypothetical protein F4779DRAFT_624022 [Xylariaceae sp. FL0662B]
MYRSADYTSSSAGFPPLPPPGYDRYDQSSYSSYPPPPPSLPLPLPPPPPPPSLGDGGLRRWDDRPPANNHDLDRYVPHDRQDDFRFRGPYSGLRQSRQNESRWDNRDRNRDTYHPPQGDFTFRVDRPSGLDPYDSYRPSERDERTSQQYDSYHPNLSRQPYRAHTRDRRGNRRPEYNQRRNRNERRSDRDGGRSRGGARGSQPQRRGGHSNPNKSNKASDRALLFRKHDDNVEVMLGDTKRRATYRDIDDLSDSDEAAMDISDNSDDDATEPARKRVRTATTTTTITTTAEDDTPKWSNPDPYTALPPPDESTRKKKDMVQLIRKARVEAESKKPAESTEAADFISCDFSDDERESRGDKNVNEKSQQSQASASAGKEGVPNAPAGFHPVPLTLPPLPPLPTEPLAQLSMTNSNPPAREPQTISAVAQGPKPAKQGSRKEPVDLRASTSLGNRKRTFDDAIKLPHASLKPAPKMRAAGDIVPVWAPTEDEDPCPWAIIDHSATPSMGTRLHKEIMDFYEYVRPREFEEQVRSEMIENLNKLVKKRWPDADVYPFGSFKSGLYLPTADMDVAICSKSFANRGIPKYYKKSMLFAMRTHLQTHRVPFRNEVELVLRAKVPLVKYTDDGTALKVDISFEKFDGHNAIQIFLDWKKKYPAMPILVALIKHFLLMRGLNEPVNGGLGGFSVICMVVNLLNQMPQVQSGSMKPEHHLGEVLMEFLDYYGNHFQYKTVAIRMNPPGLVNKSRVSNMIYRNMDRLSILDPNNPENDIAGGSANTETILRHFSRAHAILRERMSILAKGASTGDSYSTLLGPLLAGNYSSFRLQRDYMKTLSVKGLPEYEPIKRAVW